MSIAIINGEPDAAAPFDRYPRVYAERLTDVGNEVATLELRDLDLKGCSGCWGCWVKTPGECVKQRRLGGGVPHSPGRGPGGLGLAHADALHLGADSSERRTS